MVSESFNVSEELDKFESPKFQLKAYNEEGCDVISSLLQDSILHIYSHSFHEDKKCLRLMLNRFCWELLKDDSYDHISGDEEIKNTQEPQYFRVHSGLYIHNVESITVNDNFKKIVDERYLNLLAMHTSGNEVNLLFSGHKNMCINVNGLNIYLKDLHEKYPTPTCPKHRI